MLEFVITDTCKMETTGNANDKPTKGAFDMLVLEDDISVHLALETINSVTVHGVFRASEEVKAALGDRLG